VIVLHKPVSSSSRKPVPSEGELCRRARGLGLRFPETFDEWPEPDWYDLQRRRGGPLPWLSGAFRRRVEELQTVVNALYPTVTDPRLGRASRAVLRAAAWWRYRIRCYARTAGLRLLARLLPHQRPASAGF
jgi:hypothetical protein